MENTDDSNLAQCEFCGYVTDKDEIPTANDPFCSDGTVTVCPECNEGESFVNYDPDKVVAYKINYEALYEYLEKKNDIK